MFAAPAALGPLGGVDTPQHMNRQVNVNKWWGMGECKESRQENDIKKWKDIWRVDIWFLSDTN